MSERTHASTSRREFLKSTGCLAAGSVLAAGLAPRIYAGENNTIQVALIGCGGRGTGAADNALSVKSGPMKLVAMADVFEDKLKRSYQDLMKQHADKMDVPEDRRFLGFDGYKKAMDCLKPGRCGDLRDPAGLPLGPFPVRDQQGPQRVHGEARHGGRPHDQANDPACRRGRRRRTSRSASA